MRSRGGGLILSRGVDGGGGGGRAVAGGGRGGGAGAAAGEQRGAVYQQLATWLIEVGIWMGWIGSQLVINQA